MPLRDDASLWWNLPGVVAAYQPVRAPGPLLARYNMAAGGTNRYRATDGTPPAWSAAKGFTFTGASNQYLRTGWTPTDTERRSLVVAYRDAAGGILAGGEGGLTRFYIWIKVTSLYREFGNKGFLAKNTATPAYGTIAFAGYDCYVNGVYDGVMASPGSSGTREVFLGGYNNGGVVGLPLTGRLLAVAMYERILAPAEIWVASRQMNHCDVNPDWSVWGRRRQWFYGPQVGGFQAAWARNANRLPGGGA